VPSVPGLIEPLAPRYPIEDVLSIVNPDIRKPFDMNEVLLRIVDDSRLSVFKPKYGPNMITASAHIMGKIKFFKFMSHALNYDFQASLLVSLQISYLSSIQTRRRKPRSSFACAINSKSCIGISKIPISSY
jgi:hypothetical protein